MPAMGSALQFKALLRGAYLLCLVFMVGVFFSSPTFLPGTTKNNIHRRHPDVMKENDVSTAQV